jgi:Branched-chain amino acid ATP-binding cassette transporter
VLHHGEVLTTGKPAAVLSDDRVIEAYLGGRFAERAAEAARRATGAATATRTDIDKTTGDKTTRDNTPGVRHDIRPQRHRCRVRPGAGAV